MSMQQKIIANELHSAAPKTKKIKRLMQYVASFIASLGGFSLGVCLGWNSSSSELLKNYMNADSTELGLVGGIFNLGVCIGLLLVPIILKCFSRTGTMMLTVPVLFLGWSCVLFAGQTVALLLLGRILCGFSGTFCLLAPIYISEIADKNIRGTLVSIFQLMINLGIMFAFVLAYYTTDEKTIWVYSLASALTTAPLALVILIPESPLYHLTMRNEEQAKNSLKYFRGKYYEGLDTEMEELKSLVAIKESNQVTLRIFKDKRFVRGLITSFGVMIMHQFSGISPFIFYTLAIFNAGGSADISPISQTLVVGFSQIIASIIATIFIDIFGRKTLLVISSAVMGAALVLLGWFFKVQQEDPEYADKLSWMPLTWISLFFVGFNLGVGPMAWVYLGEIFPIYAKLGSGTAMGIFNWLMSLSLTLSFGEILDVIGESKTMWFFAIFCWTGLIYTVIFIKETKLMSFIEIHQNSYPRVITDSTEL